MSSAEWGDVEEVLAAVMDLPPAERSARISQLCSNRSELQAEVESLLNAHENAGSFMEVDTLFGSSAAPSSFPEGTQFGPYRLLGILGLGGMGTVYRAERTDGRFQKQVAIKVVPAALHSPELLRRFTSEQQILATLEHLNIARLLDAGISAQGIPYFVMELIEGQPLTEYCDRHKLATTDRLKLFLQVCSAVRYAHQHLIIHRDLKPSNMLVTGHGTPKLLDFGIAKILDQESAPEKPQTTMSMFRLLTPAYASPEQVKGEAITTTSDVYSLGVILYECLTGHRPYPASAQAPHEISRAVCEVEPEMPSTVIRRSETRTAREQTIEITPASVSTVRDGSPDRLGKRLRGDLDNIVLMALRKEPQRRYASVEQLAEDIRRHLENLPVLARKDTVIYRTDKFIRRHKTGAAVVLIAFVALLAGLIVTLDEVHIARVQQARAEARFNDVRKLCHSLIFEIHDSIRDVPGTTAAKKLIVESALQYLDSLTRQSGNDSRLQRELAEAYKRVGDVQAGEAESANLGDYKGALRSYEKSLAIRSGLVAEPGSLDDALSVAMLHRLSAWALGNTAQGEAALKSIESAIATSERLQAAYPDDTRVLEELRSDYQNAYDLLHELRPPDAKSLDFRRKELSLAEQIARKNPSDPSALRNLATSFRDMADALLAFNRDKEAFSVFSELRETLDKLVAISHNLADLESLPPLYHSLGYEMAERGKLPEAIALERKVVVISGELTHADPKDTHARFWFAVGNADLAAMLATIPQRAEASRAASTAIVVIGKLASEQPENQGFHVAEGELLEEAGDVFLQQGQNNRALLCYRESVSEFEKLRSGDPQNTAWPLYLATAYNSLGSALLKLGDNQGAEHAYRKAMALQQAGTSQENDWETYYAAANTYAGLGNSAAARAANRSAKLAEQRDEWRAALSWYELSDSIWRKVKRPCFPTEDAFLACVPPAEVSRRIKECQRMLQQLSLKGR